MNRTELLERIDREIELCRAELAKDTIRLIGIKSVKGEPHPGAPFGPGPRAVLDEVMRMGEAVGLYPTEHTDSIVSIGLKEGKPDLGIWIHGDVVPEGTGWNMDPYKAVEYKGHIIGRGAADNKGQLCAMFHLLKIFKKLGVELNYIPAIYVGSNEENGANDLKDFLTKHQPPKMSLIPDCGFPVGYGGKGCIYLYLRPKKPLQGVTILAGQDADPGKAVAVIGQRTVEASSLPRHMSKPDPKGNMITRLMEKLLDDPDVAPEDRPVYEIFRLLSQDVYGKAFGLDVQPKEMTPLVIGPERIDMIDGYPQIVLKIRNPIELPTEVVRERIAVVAEKYGVEIARTDEIVKPYLLDKNWPVLRRLEEVADEITGGDRPPYIIGGYTYGHLLPYAVGYGTDANIWPEDFPEGHGGAHGIHESVSLDRLQRAVRIYARALLALNEMEWEVK